MNPDKACFQHDTAYSKSNDLVKRTQSDKVLRDKAFKTVSDPKYDGYQRALASKVYKFFDKKSASLNESSGSGIDNEPNCQLANELHKPINTKFKNRKVYSFFRNNIWGIDLADMQSLSKYIKGNKYLLCATDLFSKYAWVIPDISNSKFEIPDISNLATKTTLTTVENKIPSACNLVKKKQTITQKLLKLKINLLTIIMTNILILQSLTN